MIKKILLSMNKEPILLNIGCGRTAPRKWLNIDASLTLPVTKMIPFSWRKFLHAPPWPQNAQYGDIIKGLKLKPESCRLIYAAHLLEHLSLIDCETALKNIYVYLKPGGIVRILTPDLKILCEKYFKDLKNNKEQASKNFMQESYLGAKLSQNFINNFKRNLFFGSHLWLWDEYSLRAKLEEIGFKKIKKVKSGQFGDPSFNQVEKPESFDKAFCLEAYK